jgi:lysophospholipase L1-like esterase
MHLQLKESDMKKIWLIAALFLATGLSFAQNGYIHGNGDPSTLNPIPNCGGSRFYIDDSTGKLYMAAQGSPCAWAIANSGGGSTPASNPAFPAGALADYKFLDATGTIVSDSTSNHNDGTANGAVTWIANGLKFGDEVGTNKTAGVSLPAALNASQTFLFVTYQNPIQKVLLPVTYPLLLTSSNGPTGFNLLSAYVNAAANFEGGYSVATYTNSVANNYTPNVYSGLHAIAFVCGSGSGTVDHIYIDGVEAAYGKTQGTSCGAQGAGNFFIGNSGAAPWSTQGELNGAAYRAVFWPTKLTSAQVAAASNAALAEVESRGVLPNAPNSATVGVPTLNCIGDSITFGFPNLTPFCSLLTLTNQPTYVINNWGISSVSARLVATSEPNRVAPLCQSANGYQPVALVMLGTNDFVVVTNNQATGQLIWSFNASEIATLKDAGCRVFVGTMISRSGSGVNGQTNDANKNALDGYIAGNWKNAGAYGIIDYAASPLLGADGAYANPNATGCSGGTTFQADGIHPTQCGQQLMAGIASNVLNYAFSQYSTANPHVITASATLASSDAVVSIGTLSGAVALVMPDCTGPSGATYVINNPQSAQAVTIAGGTNQTINGLSSAITIPNNSTVTLTDVANPKNVSGCRWTM